MKFVALTMNFKNCAFRRVFLQVSLVVACFMYLEGCSRGPAAVQVPDVDPADASQQAMELYDTDHDGALSDKELVSCPGIQRHMQLYDKDGNGSLSLEEVEEQIRQLLSSRVGVTSLRVDVRMNGRPLPGAQVKIVPEKYLGENVKTAYGTTNPRGTAAMDIRDEDSPASEHGLRGVHYGTYKVEVTHPEISIPEKYNTQTTLGYETEKGNPNFVVELKNR
ncbi:EF-hand domain-containing protein [Bythopirellula polymerisocia]|uniref:EF hand n=1 Tax=Bythopirellula polymerisocia TaxID=2528003 RepID=A0A5C6CV37_9BACT|nr:EF-hand domain-containing protein [Bythopirellula polymerisocia]TWU28450.1 EF hand [Bythopirellula polymerisocia]